MVLECVAVALADVLGKVTVGSCVVLTHRRLQRLQCGDARLGVSAVMARLGNPPVEVGAREVREMAVA